MSRPYKSHVTIPLNLCYVAADHQLIAPAHVDLRRRRRRLSPPPARATAGTLSPPRGRPESPCSPGPGYSGRLAVPGQGGGGGERE